MLFFFLFFLVKFQYTHCHNLFCFFNFGLGHSDPEKLNESAQAQERLSPSELLKRQLEIKVIQFLFVCVWCVCVSYLLTCFMLHCSTGNNGEN